MITTAKVITPFVCAGAGLLGAPVTVMALTILAVVAMFCTDIWGAVKPKFYSICRRRRFLSRQTNRVNWPNQAHELPPIEYEEVKWY
ncbi:hypothetical protein CUZ56_01954 [Saezia sanguinis]|uniref:Uncharacterized protein n=1 Tax=Saezia sanguinis TaxID=1965230 RepID=A0A433SD53_9BURK|nr:hypothetical protein [Saezia sanguinis]RUS66673.1 hypothetical protein CUZ56_01954 [Saezia sanguinis]